jgi:hypothetical protein
MAVSCWGRVQMRQGNLVGAGPIHITVALIIDSLMKWIIIAMNIPFGKKLLVQLNPIYFQILD